MKTLEFELLWQKSQIFGVFVAIFIEISVFVSKYADFSDFSPPITDYNPKIIRFYQFFGVIDN